MEPIPASDSSGPVRLLVSDKTHLGCQSLAESLERSSVLQAVTCATASEEVIHAVRSFPFDVALISASLSDGPLAGFKVLPIVYSANPSCASVVLLDQYDEDLVVGAFRARARGVFTRAEPFERLVKCIESVRKGQIWAGTREVMAVLKALAESSPFYAASAESIKLTKREMDIINLVTAGLTNRQISKRVNLSEHTVKNYLFRIFEKLGVASRVELAVSVMNRDTHISSNRAKPNNNKPNNNKEKPQS